MAKKSFLGKESRNLTEIINNNENIKEEIREAILGIDENPTQEGINKAIKLINNDMVLKKKEKQELLDVLRERFVNVFNFNNCPEDYESLKTEAKFLAGITQYSFFLMAQRLLKIRDKALYREDGYSDFKSFVERELNISRSTVYNYIDIVNFFGVQPVGHDDKVEYTKLLPAVSILRAEKEGLPKEEIKKQFLEDVKHKSKREIIEEANEIKVKYGLVKNGVEKQRLKKAISSFYLAIPGKLDEDDKKNIGEFLNKISKIVN
ncbi:MAG TPA: hypothetical protein PK771_12260 [Spirochaetota bacterium]|nr:hypothetical protein [Spirochaetota bacterium]